MKYLELKQSLIITDNFDTTLSYLNKLKSDNIFFLIDKRDEDFLIEDANNSINQAYIKSEKDTYIILLANKFSTISQNKLLKIIEEPPKNKFFIIIASEKTNLLTTIKSRIPTFYLTNKTSIENNINLDIKNITLEKIYNFYKENARSKKDKIQTDIEQISLAVIKSNDYKLDNNLLNFFQNSIKSLNYGLNPQFILLSFLHKILKNKISK